MKKKIIVFDLAQISYTQMESLKDISHTCTIMMESAGELLGRKQ